MRPIVDPLLLEFYREKHNRVVILSATISIAVFALATILSMWTLLIFQLVPILLFLLLFDLRRRAGIGIHALLPRELASFEGWIQRQGGVRVSGISID